MDLYYRIVNFFQSDLILTNKKGVCHIYKLFKVLLKTTNKQKQNKNQYLAKIT